MKTICLTLIAVAVLGLSAECAAQVSYDQAKAEYAAALTNYTQAITKLQTARNPAAKAPPASSQGLSAAATPFSISDAEHEVTMASGRLKRAKTSLNNLKSNGSLYTGSSAASDTVIKTIREASVKPFAKVRMANPDDRFVILQFLSKDIPAAGSHATVYRGYERVATIRLTEPMRPPFATADILDGDPEQGDEVRLSELEPTGNLESQQRTTQTATGSAKQGSVNVTCESGDGDVYVDGAFVGNTPSKLKCGEGIHVIEVKRSRFKDYKKEIKVTEGCELSLKASMEKQWSWGRDHSLKSRMTD